MFVYALLGWELPALLLVTGFDAFRLGPVQRMLMRWPGACWAIGPRTLFIGATEESRSEKRRHLDFLPIVVCLDFLQGANHVITTQ